MNALHPIPATDAGLAQVVALLHAGQVVAVPTETVYGLAADATNPEAVLTIYTTKGRPRFNPLIVHVSSLIEAQKIGAFSPTMLQLAEAFWPGPLTLVVPYVGGQNNENFIPDVVRAGLQTIAIRVPAHPVMQQLLGAVQRPLAAPSANISGRVSATQAAHVLHDFNGNVPVIDGGTSAVGLESTIVDGTTPTPTLLRVGGLARAQIEAVLGQTLAVATHDEHSPKAPGMLLKHYAPNAPVRLNANEVDAGEALLTFGTTVLQGTPTLHLSPSGNLNEAALNLFAMLREADASTPKAIAVMPIPNEGLGEAMNDRLHRAAER